MKQHRQLRAALIAFSIASACANAMAGEAGKVSSGNPSTNDVLGRASASPSTVQAQPVRRTGPRFVSEVLGRGNPPVRDAGASITTGSLDVGDFGRSSTNLAGTARRGAAADFEVAQNK